MKLVMVKKNKYTKKKKKKKEEEEEEEEERNGVASLNMQRSIINLFFNRL